MTPVSLTLESPIAGLWSTPPSRMPYQQNALVRSFLLERPTGNAVVYNSPGISAATDEIERRGGASRILINHAHEAMYGQPALDAPVFVHERDRDETERGLHVSGVFRERGRIDDDLEVILTPGHTPGTTSYLWSTAGHRFLFTGDFINIDQGQWRAVVLTSSDPNAYLASLRLVRDVDFDVLVPWAATDDGPCFSLVDEEERHGRMDRLIARVLAGGDRR